MKTEEITKPELSEQERIDLAKLELAIAQGQVQFVNVGAALWEIHDKKLWRDHHASFQDYCERRWHFSMRWVYKLIQGWEIRQEIADKKASVNQGSHGSDRINIDDPASCSAFSVSETPLPVPGKQTAALAKVPKKKRAEVWDKAVAATNGKPTEKAIDEAAAKTSKRSKPKGKKAEPQDRIFPRHIQPPESSGPCPGVTQEAVHDRIRNAYCGNGHPAAVAEKPAVVAASLLVALDKLVTIKAVLAAFDAEIESDPIYWTHESGWEAMRAVLAKL